MALKLLWTKSAGGQFKEKFPFAHLTLELPCMSGQWERDSEVPYLLADTWVIGLPGWLAVVVTSTVTTVTIRRFAKGKRMLARPVSP